VGQVQSNVGGKITVNFPDAGKVVVDGTRIILQLVPANTSNYNSR